MKASPLRAIFVIAAAGCLFIVSCDLLDSLPSPSPTSSSSPGPTGTPEASASPTAAPTASPSSSPDNGIYPFNLTFLVKDKTQALALPFSFIKTGRTRGSGGSSSVTYGYSSEVIRPAEITPWEVVNPGDSFRLQVRSYGYRPSPELSFTAAELAPNKDASPVVTIELEPENSKALLSYQGITAENDHLYKARILESAFIEEAIAGFGAGIDDKYTYVLGFKLKYLLPNPNPNVPGTLTGLNLAPSPTGTPGPMSEFVYADYDSSAALGKDAYKNLSVDLLLDTAGHETVLDPSVKKVMQIYVEVLALKGDGSSVIDNDDEYLGFASERLLLSDQQIVYD